MEKAQYQSVFVSDIHLGTKACKAKRLLEFLNSFEAENLFLVGDIIDGWALRRRHYWTKSQTECIRRVLKMSEKMNVFYIAGNHDEFIRPFFKYGFQFTNIQILDSYDYTGIDGRNYFVSHGDYYDMTMRIPTPILNLLAHIWDYVPHSDSNSSLSHITDKILGTEQNIVKHAVKKGYDAAVCGHTHSPKITTNYMNCGDWVKNCTALVEHVDGRWELLYNTQ